MSKKAGLDTQTGKICLVIRKDKEINIDLLTAYLNAFYKEWSYIIHRNDKNPDTGEIIPIHYHVVGNHKNKNSRLSTKLNELVDALELDNANGVEIDKYNSYALSLQYLTHQNQPNKTQHDKGEIVSSMSREELNTFLSAECDTITFDYLYTICVSSNNIIEVIRDLGLSHYKEWRNVIWDIWNCLKEERLINNKI